MEIDDIEQELMCSIMLSLKNFDPQKGKFSSFVNSVLHKISVDLIRAYFTDKRLTSLGYLQPYNDQFYKEIDSIKFDDLKLIEQLPCKYRLLYCLLKSYLISEISQITKIPRSSVYRSIKLLYSYINHVSNSENIISFYMRSKFKMKNLSDIETLNVKELSRLAVYDLADLNDQLSKLISHTKELKEKFEDALNLRFSETVQSNLRSENRDTGTTKFIENGFQITAEVPKKVTWDSEKISEIIKNISEEKRKAIIKTTHVIDERKYAQLSIEDKNLFAEARTVTPGKIRFQISIPEEI